MNEMELRAYRYQFFYYCRRFLEVQRFLDPETLEGWKDWVNSVEFEDRGDGLAISWEKPRAGSIDVKTDDLCWFDMVTDDTVSRQNHGIMERHVRAALHAGGLKVHPGNTPEAILEGQFHRHFLEEEMLFDSWAKEIDPAKIDVRLMNESITAPEMRFITNYLGDIQGKTLVDIGCGLGEAGVYFAMRGADVTAVDLSREMLIEVEKLAAANGQKIKTHRALAEHLHLPPSTQFDIAYAGNVFHHVDIDTALNEVTAHLKDDGILVCWEPVDYNPVINIYRRIARQVRSADERPIRKSDLDKFRNHFEIVETHWFWLTTLLIFVIMFVFQRRDPNRERYWKSVVVEGERWKWLYAPLEKLDKWLLAKFPVLGYLCWNVVIIGRRKITGRKTG